LFLDVNSVIILSLIFESTRKKWHWIASVVEKSFQTQPISRLGIIIPCIMDMLMERCRHLLQIGVHMLLGPFP
jgi:hypothetical protein